MWKLRRLEETFAQILPMTHSGGLNCGANCSIFNGSKSVILRRFDPAQLLDLIEKYHVSVMAGVPTVYSALIHDPSMSSKRGLSSLRICLSSGAPLSEEIATRFQNMTGMKIVVGWGLTEASPQLTMCTPDTGFRPNYVGKPLPNTQVVAIDEAQNLLPMGCVGELAAKGPQVMKEYWMNDEETKKVFTEDGWLRTGDTGSISSDGVYLLGRKKDVIDSAGFKIWPHEVESVLLENDRVREAAVVGADDPDRGEIVVAFVVLKNEKIKEEDLKEFCKSRLTTYKVPRKFVFVESLPKSSVGKVLHRVLREKFQKEKT
jgi:long-chain acyl-CoA synthetase